MAFAPSAVYPIREGGAFIEKDHGNLFEYDLHGESLLPEYPHRVWVSENPVNDSGWRYALVKKTVAYIAVDEDEFGLPVLEKWYLKKNTEYLN